MNESSLTKVHRRRLLTQVNPCIPTNVTPKPAPPDLNGPSPNGRLRLRTCCRKRYHRAVLPMSLLPIPAFCRQAAPATTSHLPVVRGNPRRTLITSIHPTGE